MDHTVDYSCIWIYTKILSLHSKIFRSIEQHSLHPGSEYQGRARGQRTQMARGAPQAHGRGGGGPRGGQPRTGHHHFKITKRFSSTGSQCFVMVGHQSCEDLLRQQVATVSAHEPEEDHKSSSLKPCEWVVENRCTLLIRYLEKDRDKIERSEDQGCWSCNDETVRWAPTTRPWATAACATATSTWPSTPTCARSTRSSTWWPTTASCPARSTAGTRSSWGWGT